ncbi:MAG: PAS domain S-box protein, partial [Rhodocyclaceae bacterium]|nr:PAS domain S-box protein [Rhodocyclaceae bacterium]
MKPRLPDGDSLPASPDAATLRENEERLRLALEGTADGIWDWNLPTGEAWFSPRYYTMLGYEPGEFPASFESWRNIVHPDDVGRAEADIGAYLGGTGESFATEFRCRTRDGRWRWILGRGKVVKRDAAGNPLRLAGSHSDITERREAEEALRFTQFTVDHASEAIFWFDADGRFTYVNEEAGRMLGYPPGALVGMGIPDVDERLGPEDIGPIIAEITRKGTVKLETVQRRSDGTLIDVAVSSRHLTYGGQTRFVAHIRDVTERKLLERTIREREAFLRAVVDNEPECVMVLDRGGRLLDINAAGLAMLEAGSSEGLLGQTFCSTVMERDAAVFKEALAAVFGGASRAFQFRVRTRRGNERWLDIHAVPLMDPVDAGQVRAFLAVARDVTERLAAETAVRRERAFSETLLDSLPGIFYQFDDQGRMVRWNRSFAEIVGLPDEKLAGMQVTDFIAEPDRGLIAERFGEVLTKGSATAEAGLLTSGGETIPFFFTGRALREGGRDYLVGAGVDITERRRAEEAARLIRFGVDRSADAFFLIGPDNRFLDVNEAACAALGYSREELMAKAIEDVDPDVSAEVAAGMFDALRRQGRLRFETRHRRRDGSIFPVEIMANYIEFAGREFNFCFARDMTDRKRDEENLRNSERDLHLALEVARLGHWKWDLRSGEVIWSDRCKALYGLTPETQVTYELFQSLVHPEDRARVAAEFNRALEERSGYELEKRIVWPDGSTRWTASLGRVVCDAESQPVLVAGVTMDITERRQAEEALRESEARLRAAIESAPFDFFLIGRDGRYLLQNSACRQSWGDVVGRQPEEVTDDAALLAHWRRNNVRALAGEVVREEVRIADGDRYIYNIIAPILDRDAIKGIVGLNIDISDRKRAEAELERHREHLEELVAERTADLGKAMHQLVQSEKLAALGNLVAGVAHELNTPLGNARMVASTLQEELDGFAASFRGGALRRSTVEEFIERSRKAVELLERNAARAADLISHFKQVA